MVITGWGPSGNRRLVPAEIEPRELLVQLSAAVDSLAARNPYSSSSSFTLFPRLYHVCRSLAKRQMRLGRPVHQVVLPVRHLSVSALIAGPYGSVRVASCRAQDLLRSASRALNHSSPSMKLSADADARQTRAARPQPRAEDYLTPVALPARRHDHQALPS